MSFSTSIAQLADAAIDSLGGESVVYTAPGGSGVTITAVVEPMDVEGYDEQGIRANKRALKISAKTSDIADFARGASVTYRSERYAVMRQMYRDEAMIGLWCEQIEVLTQGPRNARRP